MTPSTNTSSQSITVLPDRLIDQIAAGEVIERPASVVKELVENALDAGATQIDIEIEAAGSELIRVVDNGHGMVAEDIANSVQRHATSKIKRLEDLSSLISFGFRGEALASVASVSHLEIVSRHRERDEARLMFWEGGALSEDTDTGAAIGTAVTVRHLFFNTPARREFLRAPTTETRRIIEAVTDFATIHHDIGFSLITDGRQTIQAAPAPDLRGRITDLFGTSVANAMIPFSGNDTDIEVTGLAGKPEIARGTRDRILTYVNKRRISSASLAHACTAAYGETIPRGRYPFVIVSVAINPHRVDVNVHPTKREVRFSNDRMVHDITYYSINRAVFAGKQTAPVLNMKPQYISVPPTNETLPLSAGPLSSPEAAPKPQPTTVPPSPQSTESTTSTQSTDSAPPAPPAERTPPHPAGGVTNLWQFNDVYIVAAVGEELWVIDQHTAHERVLYEEVLQRIHSRRPDTQRLLFPETFEIEAAEWETFESSEELLAALGFEVRPFGSRTVLLEGVPNNMRIKNPVHLFRRVLEDIDQARRGGEDITKAAAASMACRSAVMAGDRLKHEEMQTLFARLMHTENPFSCPHGRPTMVKIPFLEFDKKFCRA
ncbi:MAG: DNA mismatch repair endonuclease MutL [candidate division Zixibacteria bacterium]|nr:DNA mismatch repair endonuclease MutL [candidate division Zixibacteria bacterium]